MVGWRGEEVGNPNVGRSVSFSRLAGCCVAGSNYPGTTVEVTRARGRLGGREYEVVDSSGMHSLLPITEEKRVAWLREMLGLPKGCGGLLTSGGTQASFLALAPTARPGLRAMSEPSRTGAGSPRDVPLVCPGRPFMAAGPRRRLMLSHVPAGHPGALTPALARARGPQLVPWRLLSSVLFVLLVAHLRLYLRLWSWRKIGRPARSDLQRPRLYGVGSSGSVSARAR